MKILAIDTSGLTATVALCEDDRLVSVFSIQYKTTHSQILMPMLEKIKELTSLDLKTIDAIALAAGPGSFTGLRIGTATAKGLCLALNVPLIAVPTLDAMAYNLYGVERLICPMMDARRSQVYTGVYTFVPEKREDTSLYTYSMKTILDQKCASIDEIADFLNAQGKPVTILGDGVPVYLDSLEQKLKVPFSVASVSQDRQNAASLCQAAAQYMREGRTVDADSFAPEYLRVSQAERTSLEKKTEDNTGKSPDSGTGSAKSDSDANAFGMKIPKVKERVFIRLLKAEDIDRAADLEKENLGNEAWTLEQLLTASTRDDTIYLVAEKQGQIIGLCGVQNIQGDGEITNVSVDKNMRGEGVGFKMMRQLLERGRGIGIVNYTMEVRSSNVAARKLYEKLGFKSDGKRPGFYDNPRDDAEIYWLRNTQSE